MLIVREWRNEEWEKDTTKARTQEELQFMARKIISTAEIVENEPTPGSTRPDLSRVLICKSSLLPNVRYIIHTQGFTVEDIIEEIKKEVAE